MFGYVNPYKEELKVKDYELFKGYYCGLCKTLGREFNQGLRFGLNYDLTFLALLLSSLEKDKDRISFEGCIANPFKKKLVINQNRAFEYASNISAILVYFKLIDDWRDEKSLKSVLVLPIYWFPVRKTKKIYLDKYNHIREYLRQLSALEKEECDNIDKSADLFAKIMEEIAIPPFIEDDKTKRVLKWLGYNLGRWIYIIDAFNDIEKDIKNKNYNPILLQYRYKEGEDINKFKSRIIEPIDFTLTYTLDNLAKSFELLDINYNNDILENIVYMGTRRKMEQILYKKESIKHEKSL